jgi:hypothetical protein
MLSILSQIPKSQNLPSIDRGINVHANTDDDSTTQPILIAKSQTHQLAVAPRPWDDATDNEMVAVADLGF